MSTSGSDAPKKPERPKARPWEKPHVVDYGHLSKITRGPSGTVSETSGFKKPPPPMMA